MSLQILMSAHPRLYAMETNIQAAQTQREVMNVLVQKDTITPTAQIKPVLKVEKNIVFSMSYHKCSGVSGGSRRPPPPPLRTKIFSISCSFSENLVKIICWRPRWGVGALSYGNPGSAPGSVLSQNGVESRCSKFNPTPQI